MTSIRTILSLVVVEDLHLEQLDVKTSFLHGDLEEDIYMQQPQGYEVKGKENLVCMLKKSLYGLKKSPRQWYLKFDKFMTEQVYNICHSDHCVYFKRRENGSYIIFLLYVCYSKICLTIDILHRGPFSISLCRVIIPF